MKSIFVVVFVVASYLVFVGALNQTSKSTGRENLGRQFSFLQVIKFPNSACPASGNRNGTCYTTDECTNKKGVASGSCANGFGVCCVFTLTCGQKSSENCTFLTLSSTASSNVPNNCVFSLCECNPNICRIRLDFMTFTIGGPVLGTTGGAVTLAGGAIGDCTGDSFVLSSPGNKGSPAICGVNSGQHMIVDSSSTSCAMAAFSFAATPTTRSFDIKVTQFACGDEMAGPPDCLQYFTSAQGTIKSFNFAPSSAPVTSTITHLSNQCYTMCIRRMSGMCAICYSPAINPVAAATGPATQASFGLSVSTNIAAQSAVDGSCSHDYLIIPTAAALNTLNTMGVVRGVDRICGRFFNLADGQTGSTTICSSMRPFRMVFKTDANELNGTPALNDATTNELLVAPGGIVGFSLNYFQVSC